MSYRSIFGEDLTDYDIEVIIDNPAVRTWWAQSKGREKVLQQWQRDRTLRGTMMNLLKAGSKVAGVGAAMYGALKANKERKREDYTHTGTFPAEGKINERKAYLRGTSFHNLP